MIRVLLTAVLVLCGLPASAQSWALVDSDISENAATGTTIAVSVSGVSSGNFVGICAGHNNGTDVAISSIQDGSANSATLLTNAGDSQENVRIGYWLASPVSGSVTYTATFASSVIFRHIAVFVMSYTGTASFDAEAADAGLSASISTGNVATTGTDELYMACATSSQSIVSQLIAGAPPDELLQSFSNYSFYRRSLTSTVTDDATAALGGGGSFWVASAAAFKAVAAAPPSGSDSGGGCPGCPSLAGMRWLGKRSRR